LIEARERIRINGELLSKEKFVNYFWQCYNSIDNAVQKSTDEVRRLILKSRREFFEIKGKLITETKYTHTIVENFGSHRKVSTTLEWGGVPPPLSLARDDLLQRWKRYPLIYCN
jgi:hypothetical protein